MKKVYTVLLLLLTTLSSVAQNDTITPISEVTTYYLIRHSEKDRSDPSNKNPELTKKGFYRAASWAEVFEFIPLDAVYATNYNRTLMTASPTAMAQNIQITVYHPKEKYTDSFKENTAGKNVLIVGHSNTIPSFVNDILGENKYSDMNDRDNSSLYIVTVIGNTKSVQVLNIH